jgi:hypothetical protein
MAARDAPFRESRSIGDVVEVALQHQSNEAGIPDPSDIWD